MTHTDSSSSVPSEDTQYPCGTCDLVVPVTNLLIGTREASFMSIVVNGFMRNAKVWEVDRMTC